MRPRRSTLALILGPLTLALAGATGCKTAPGDVRDDRTSTRAAELSPSPPSRPAAPAVVEQVSVPGDDGALVLVGAGPNRPIVYLHGMCSEPRSDLEAFGPGVRPHGTLIGLVGDQECPDKPNRHTWTADPAKIDGRIDAAIEAVRTSRQVPLDPGEIIVIGESLGASRATALARRFPAKYKRLVLVGGPSTPTPEDLRDVESVALLAGEKESQQKMREGARILDGAGIRARFWELPDATHGTYGSEGDRWMAEAVAFAASR